MSDDHGRDSMISDLWQRSLRPVGIRFEPDGFLVFDVDPDAPPITDDDVVRAAQDCPSDGHHAR